jgi:hypothetical protein
LEGLLSDHADATALEAERSQIKSDDGSRVTEDLFRCLTDINADGQAIRRPQTLALLVQLTGAEEPALRSIIDAFRAEGVSFLRPYGSAPLSRDTLIDISHEALIRCWKKIAEPKDGWLIREFRNGLVWRALLVQADSFERDPTNVLAPTTTDEREQWMQRRNAAWAERYGGGWERVQKLLAASVAERDRGRAEQTEARKREEKERLREQRFRIVSYGSIIVLFCLGVAIYSAWTANQASSRAQEADSEARKELNEAKVQSALAVAERNTSERLRAEAETSAEELRRLVKKLSNSTPTGAGSQTTYGTTVQAIENVADKLSQSKLPLVDGPRIYLHITDSRYRTAARQFELALETTPLGNAKVVVPGIQLVNASPRRAELRCFSSEECQGEARRVLDLANGILQEPQLELTDLSARYGDSTSIRPRHYEIWFPPGNIALKSSRSS